MIKIPSIEEINTDPSLISLNEFFKEMFNIIDKKFNKIDLCPTKKNKTPFCKHKKSCVHNLITSFFKGYFKCFGVQFFINFIFFLIRLAKNKVKLSQILFQLFTKKTLRIGFFLGIQNFVLRLVTCSLRFWMMKNSIYIDIFAGFLAGFMSYQFLNTKTQQLVGFFIFSRIFDTFFKILEEKHKLKYKNIVAKTFFYTLVITVSGYAFTIEPEYCNQSLFKIYHNFCTFDRNLLKFKSLWKIMKDKELLT